MNLLIFNLAIDRDDPVLGFACSWIAALARRVTSVQAVTMRSGAFEFPGNVRVWSLGKELGYSEPRRAFRFYRILADIVMGHKVDVSFSHMSPVFSVMASPVLRPLGVPLVTWFAHRSLSWKLRAAHLVSTRMVTSVRSAYPHRSEKLVPIGQGIDTVLFRPEVATEARLPVVLCVGRLSAVKDHPTLLRAAKILDRRGVPFRLRIRGNPALQKDKAYSLLLRSLVDELGLQRRVEFENAVPVRELPWEYASCSVHVNLTGYGSGDKVVLEAMSCGKPSLVANEGFRPILGEYVERLYFPPGDHLELANQLQKILEMSPDQRGAIGQYLRGQVEKHHSLEGLADKLVGLFQVIKGEHRRAGVQG